MLLLATITLHHLCGIFHHLLYVIRCIFILRNNMDLIFQRCLRISSLLILLKFTIRRFVLPGFNVSVVWRVACGTPPVVYLLLPWFAALLPATRDIIFITPQVRVLHHF